MATDLAEKSKPASAPKYETFVENQLARVRGRVRALDAGRATLLFFIVTFAYGLVMALADRTLELPPEVRLGAFLVYFMAAAFFLGWTLLCLGRRVNPYYAAKQLELTLPDAKNSVVNWLDLRDEKLPAAIHGALGLRAARDLKKADPEQAVSSGPAWLLGGIMAGLVLALLILFVMGPQQFGSLMQRAFAPFREAGIATRASITLVEPAGGNVTVSPNRPVTFRAQIDGRVPPINQEGAPHLHYRYNPSDGFARQPLDQDADGSWYWTMPADLVINGGLWYRMTAGDAETEEFEIKVTPIPQVRLYEVTYHYRPYRGLIDQTHTYPKTLFRRLRAHRGTEATLVVRTNCTVREGWLQVDWSDGKKDELPGEILGDDPGALRFSKLLLDQDGQFKVLFKSKEGHENIDRSPYPIEVFLDNAPRVELKKPGKDIQLPANGTLQLEGLASDDFGIKSVTLRMKVLEGDTTPVLAPKPYRPGRFQLDDGKYPDFLEYKDFVALEKLKTDKGAPFPLAKGMVLQYWLEAVDNSDYPDKNGNLGKSEAYKVVILDPEKDQKKQQQERNQAQKQKEQHDKKQDQELKERNDAAKQDKNPKNPQDENARREKQKLEQEKKDLDKAEKDIKDKLDKQSQDNKGPDNKGEAKGADPQPKGSGKGGKSDQSKPSPEPKAKDGPKDGQDKAGQNKDGPKDGQENKTGEAKDGGNKDSGEKNPKAEARGGGKDNSDAGPRGSADKNDPTQPNKEQAADAGKSKPGSKEKMNQAKAKGKEKETDVSQPKDQGTDGQGEKSAVKGEEKPDPAAASKSAGEKGEKQPQAKDSSASAQNTATKSEPKDADPKQADGAAQAKGDKESNAAKESSLEDIARLNKDLQEGDAKAKENAEKELSRIAKAADSSPG